jgi:putative transposase
MTTPASGPPAPPSSRAVPWQRCQFHLQQNAQAYVRAWINAPEVAQAIRSVFDCPDRLTAQARLKEVVAAHAPPPPNWPLGWRKISRKA